MKLNFVKVIFLSLFLLISMSGCGTVKILHIPKQKVQRDMPAYDINHAIKIALRKARWKIVENEKNNIIASLGGRRWSIKIDIKNTKETYKINYLESKNLKYNQNSQKIHPAYNKYVMKLKKQIDIEIRRVKITKKIEPVKKIENKYTEVQSDKYSQTSSENISKTDVSKEVEIW